MALSTHDVIILGLGGMGSATAFELARRGLSVLGLEQYAPGHDRGSSHGMTRVIRKAYFEHPDYVPLLHRAYERWYDLEQHSGRHLFTSCPCLSLGRPDGEVIPGVRQAAAQHQLPIETFTHEELRQRYPQFHLPEDFVGVLEREAGFLFVEDCVRAHAEQARLLGADLHENEPVTSWKAEGDTVRVQTTHDTYTAARLVVTAGAWAGPMLADLGLPLTVLRKTLFWFGTDTPQAFRRDRFPIYLTETPNGFYYGFPMIDGDGHKVARHDGGEPIATPEQLHRDHLPGEEEECRAFLRTYLPGVNGPLRRTRVCMYTMTPDHHFLMDRHPAFPQVVFAAGFSGHGFKFASVVGEVLADLAEQGRTDLPIGMFRLDRFDKYLREG